VGTDALEGRRLGTAEELAAYLDRRVDFLLTCSTSRASSCEVIPIDRPIERRRRTHRPSNHTRRKSRRGGDQEPTFHFVSSPF
jgi:hypothetical protein